ncbi:TAP-like protein [Actinomadura pelletieri DSM 43383]|uniref:TAP-like protein n=2 Tax=Actinomadura pelletieri TaxID=111805 RepID=A0A495QNZ0_9ACTN|nr:TAP-like protein [Actinomadura pelletieri DSM 43383]
MGRFWVIVGIITVGAAAMAASGPHYSAGSTRARQAAFTSLPSPTEAATAAAPDWKRCTGLPKLPRGASPPASLFRCATLEVPLDHSRPSGEKIGIALIRVPATDPRHRIGSLLFNFGGPGGDGVTTLAQVAGQYNALRARYDLVGFDPRGVGRSAPVRCAGARQMDRLLALDDSPDTAAERAAYIGGRAAFNKECAARSGRLLPHVGTVDAVRDLDLIRAALGDDRLHYFGISYGTWLGGAYAHRYPHRVGRAVLDGAVDTTIGSADLALQQAAGFQRALGEFGRACARLGRRSCPLGTDGPSVVRSVARILDRLDTRTLPTLGGRRLTQSLGTTGVVAGLYSRDAWPYLAQGLVDAVKRHDGTLLLLLADAQNGRQENGAYTNLTAANTAITCADGTDRHGPADVRRLLPAFRRASPVFGTSMAWALLQCTGWPVPGDATARGVSAPSAAPILVIGNTGDPATPYRWAHALTRELGGRAALLTLRGQGHGAYDTGDRCVRSTVHAYLFHGTVPRAGATCG